MDCQSEISNRRRTHLRTGRPTTPSSRRRYPIRYASAVPEPHSATNGRRSVTASNASGSGEAESPDPRRKRRSVASSQTPAYPCGSGRRLRSRRSHALSVISVLKPLYRILSKATEVSTGPLRRASPAQLSPREPVTRACERTDIDRFGPVVRAISGSVSASVVAYPTFSIYQNTVYRGSPPKRRSYRSSHGLFGSVCPQKT